MMIRSREIKHSLSDIVITIFIDLSDGEEEHSLNKFK